MKPARVLFLAIASCLIALVCYSAAARAANWPAPQLDQIGSALSGKSVNVYCEDSWLPWETFFANQGIDGTDIAGFTYTYTGSTLFVSPKICENLHALISHEDVGTYHASQAILVLTHEAMHQKLQSSNEALVECNALKLFPTVAQTYFNVPTTEAQTYLANVVRKVRVGKKVRRVTVTVARVRTVVSPYFTRLVADAARWDAAMPAAYHGAVC